MTATSELHELATKKGVRVDFKFLEPFNFEFKHSMRMWNKKEMMGNYRCAGWFARSSMKIRSNLLQGSTECCCI